MKMTRTMARLPVALTLVVALSGCNALTRLANVGSEPPLTPIQNPVLQESYRPVSMPMPAPKPMERNANSLWRTGSRAFFKDQRASAVGDILTVVVDLQDQATLNNATTRNRTSNEDASLGALLGYETALDFIFPEAVNNTDLIDASARHDATGTGTISRNEDIDLKIAAVISQVLPNGNLVIYGRQEIRINFEARELQVAGVIRPQDISSANTIEYEQIAEARISYGGRGQLSDLQQPRYGQQIYDILFPF